MPPEVLASPDLLPNLVKPGTRMSDDELIRFSRANRPYRFERNKEGEITMMSPVGGIGSLHEMRVTSALSRWSDVDGRGIAFAPNVGFNLRDRSCLAPDAAWLELARWNALTHEQQVGFPPLCPDFLVEVRSHSDRRRSLEEKMLQWMGNGAKLAWLLDPIECTVTIYRMGERERTLNRPDFVDGVDPVGGFTLNTAKIWTSA